MSEFAARCRFERTFGLLGPGPSEKFHHMPEYEWLVVNLGYEGYGWGVHFGWLDSEGKRPVAVMFEREVDAVKFGMVFDVQPERIEHYVFRDQ